MNTVEIVYRWENGKEEVRYRRPEGSEMANQLIAEVDALQAKAKEGGYVSPYFYRIVPDQEAKCKKK